MNTQPSLFNARRALVVVAHPDDEVLGCGGTVRRMADAGIEVDICILSGSVNARSQRPSDEELSNDLRKATAIIGARSLYLGEFENIKLNVVPHLHLVQFIEAAIQETQPDVVFTHHPSDLNNDHTQTSAACQTAIRLPLRNAAVAPVSALYYMETASATEWAVPGGAEPFRPTTFVNIESSVEAKINALAAYRNVMRPRPHPRSREVIEAMAVCRGAQAGFNYAEAFQLAFQRL